MPAKKVEDTGNAANNATNFTRNIPAVFKGIRQAGWKLTLEKCHFGVRQVECFGRTISSERVSPQARNSEPSKLRIPKSNSTIQRYLWVVKFYRNYIQDGWKTQPVLQAIGSRNSNQQHVRPQKKHDSVNKALNNASDLALNQLFLRNQLVLKTDTSFRSARYALIIENNPDQKVQSKRQTYAPVAVCSKNFSPA